MKKIIHLLSLLVCLIACSEGYNQTDAAFSVDEVNKKAWQFNDKAKKREESRDTEKAIEAYQEALHYFRLSQNDTMVIKTLENLGICYWETQHYDQAISVFLEQLKWITTTENVALLPACYNNLGLVYYSMDDYSNAIKYYGLAINKFRELDDKESLATSLLNLGILLKNQGIYEDALTLLFEAEQYLWKAGESKALASCYEAIGLVNHNLKEYDEAIEYHRQALEIRTKLKYEKGIAKSFNNLGLGFMELKDYDSAQVYFEKSMKLKEMLGYSRSLISTIENIGKVNERSGNLQTAEDYYSQGIRLSDEYKSPKEQALLYHSMGRLKIKQGHFVEAKVLLEKVEKVIDKIKSRSLLVENLKLKKELYTEKGDYHEALKNTELYLIAKDSLLNREKNNHIAQLKVLHQVEEKEQENTLLKQEARVEKLKFHYTLVIATLMLVLLVGAIFLYITKNKAEKREKLLRKEMDHRTKNNFQLLSALLTLHADSLEDEIAVEAVKSYEGRVNAMAIIHEKLYQHIEKQDVDMYEFITELLKYLQKSYNISNQEIHLNMEIEHLQMDVSQAIPMGLIMNEVITNAFKYAFNHNPHPELSVLLRQKGKKTELIVHDNGPGLSGEFVDKEPSFGRKLIRLLSKQLKGTYEYKSDHGTRFELVV